MFQGNTTAVKRNPEPVTNVLVVALIAGLGYAGWRLLAKKKGAGANTYLYKVVQVPGLNEWEAWVLTPAGGHVVLRDAQGNTIQYSSVPQATEAAVAWITSKGGTAAEWTG